MICLLALRGPPAVFHGLPNEAHGSQTHVRSPTTGSKLTLEPYCQCFTKSMMGEGWSWVSLLCFTSSLPPGPLIEASSKVQAGHRGPSLKCLQCWNSLTGALSSHRSSLCQATPHRCVCGCECLYRELLTVESWMQRPSSQDTPSLSYPQLHHQSPHLWLSITGLELLTRLQVAHSRSACLGQS